MGGGGGGGGGNDWTYWQNIQQDKDNAAANAARQAQADAQARLDTAQSTYNTNLANARANAQGTAQRYFSDRGLTFDQDLVNSIINRVAVPNLDANPESYFTPDVFATGIAQQEQAQRQKYANQVDALFKPGFERTLLSDAAADPITASILGEQRKTAQTTLDYNRNRGLLNDIGYNQAMNVLGGQENTGRATLNDIATSVLGKERQGLTDIRGEAGTAASGYNYGAAAPDFSTYWTRASDLAGKDIANLEGSIRGAVGSTNLFDVPTALAKGGIAQGPINLTTAPTTAPTPLADRTKVASRTQPSTGVF